MTSFNYITKKIINTDNNFFSFNYDNSDMVNPVFKTLFTSIVNNSYKSKFLVFKQAINNFLHFSRDEFIDYFCKIQKIYHGFSRLAYLYKYKKSVMSVTTDMGLNDININDKNILCIYHVNSRYLFNVNDLIKIIYLSLTNSYLFFAEPLPSKNPYNNLPFTKSNLYNIYFFIKFNTNIHDDLFFKFFNCDFNLSLFYNKYEHIMREHSITNYIKNSTTPVLVEQINKMISIYNYKNSGNKILINSEFPKDKLIKIMKPYLILHLQSYYSLIPVIKRTTGFELHSKLKRFQKFNPQFGRKQIKLSFKLCPNFKKKSYIKGYNFNDKHITFNYEEDNTKFMSNHLNFTEVNDYDIINNINNVNDIRISFNIRDIIFMTDINRRFENYIHESENEIIDESENESDNTSTDIDDNNDNDNNESNQQNNYETSDDDINLDEDSIS
jgi:hypothetical protein